MRSCRRLVGTPVYDLVRNIVRILVRDAYTNVEVALDVGRRRLAAVLTIKFFVLQGEVGRDAIAELIAQLRCDGRSYVCRHKGYIVSR